MNNEKNEKKRVEFNSNNLNKRNQRFDQKIKNTELRSNLKGENFETSETEIRVTSVQEKMNNILKKYQKKYSNILKALKKLTNLNEKDLIHVIKVILTTPGFAV